MHHTAPIVLHRLVLEEWRNFRELAVDFQPPTDPDRGQWIFILGPNSSGKSNVLRAITLAVVSDQLGKTLLMTTGPSNPHIRAAADACSARIHLCSNMGFPTTIAERRLNYEVLIDRRTMRCVRPFVVAYGPYRGTAVGGSGVDPDRYGVQAVLTMFSEGATLIHAETWLRQWALAEVQGKDPKGFFSTVKQLLVRILPDVTQIDVEPERVWISGPMVGRVPLSVLGTGHLMVFGWVLDMIARWAERMRVYNQPLGVDFTEMVGVALIDGVDLHLDRSWCYEVLTNVRKAFPKMTFVVTARDLLGCPGEVSCVYLDGPTVDSTGPKGPSDE